MPPFKSEAAVIQQNSVPMRARVGSTLPSALLLMVGISIVAAGEICLEAELRQIVESALSPRPQPAPDVIAASAERELLADVMALMAADPLVQRASDLRVVDGTAPGEVSVGTR
jgi:hypothetical protein